MRIPVKTATVVPRLIRDLRELDNAPHDGQPVPLTASRQYGPYEIVAPLSAGVWVKCIEPVTHGCIGGRAHSAGIVYRDLKPENVMITADGRAKILTSVSPSRSCPNRPRARDLVTETGMVFGTVPNMSPEQARGEEVDYRSDQFSWES